MFQLAPPHGRAMNYKMLLLKSCSPLRIIIPPPPPAVPLYNTTSVEACGQKSAPFSPPLNDIFHFKRATRRSNCQPLIVSQNGKKKLYKKNFFNEEIFSFAQRWEVCNNTIVIKVRSHFSLFLLEQNGRRDSSGNLLLFEYCSDNLLYRLD